MPPVTTDRTMPVAAGIRRSGRVCKEVPIILSGADAEGRQFSERTHTLLLSLHGASVISQHKLIPEQEIYLRVVATNKEIEVRICGEIGERMDGHIYGVAFANNDLNFWKMEFPPAEALPKNLVPVTLECSGCRRQVALQFDATEIDVYLVNEGMLRYCTQCGVSTIWKIMAKRPPVVDDTPRVAPYPEPNFNAPLPTERDLLPLADASAAPPAPVNRRSERRTRVNYNACIRVNGSQEEVVPCQDMSRGGFCFHSPRPYGVETMIEAAVPYMPGGSSIFVPAQIANVAALQSGKLFRYGVAYVKAPKRL
jgi:hypothetical protein